MIKETHTRTPENSFKPEYVCIVLLTKYDNWYPGELKGIGDTDKVRGDLALKSIEAGRMRNYNLVISDAGSNDDFVRELNRAGVTILDRQGKSRGFGRRQGFEAASKISDVKVIMRTEPEKVQLVEEFIPDIAAPIASGEADIVVPKRNLELFQQTYPDYMYASEVDMNRKYNEKLLQAFGLLPQGEYLDLFFGPVAFRNDPKVLDLFMHMYEFTKYSEVGLRSYPKPDEYSDGHVFPIIEGLHTGLRVKSVEIGFRYPQLQRQNEEIGAKEQFTQKRGEQRWAHIDEGIHFIRYLRDPNSPKTGIKRVS